jgi:acyl-coenzyme A thioesterase PaaI-like protein
MGTGEEFVEQVGWVVPETYPPGARAERRRLAQALRALAASCVTADPPEDVLRAAADALEQQLESLNEHPGKTFRDALSDGSHVFDPTVFGDRSALIGRSNPFAPPLRLVAEGDVSVGVVAFGTPYEGAPGWVHGGLVAAAFDQVFGYAQVRRGIGSVTSRLTVRYLRPTPIRTELRFEATVKRAEGRETDLAGKLLVDGRVIATAEALFITIDPEAFTAKLLAKDAKPT